MINQDFGLDFSRHSRVLIVWTAELGQLREGVSGILTPLVNAVDGNAVCHTWAGLSLIASVSHIQDQLNSLRC